MASLITKPKHKKRIIYTLGGARKSIYLGNMPIKAAEQIKRNVECLVSSKISGEPCDNKTDEWVRDLSDELAGKLAKVGLIAKREKVTLGGLIDAFIKSHSHVKPATLIMWNQAGNDLLKHFEKKQPLRSISRENAEEFRQGLVRRGLAGSTINKRLQRVRQLFKYAVRFEWLNKNPFEGITHKGAIHASGSIISRLRTPRN